MTPMSSRTKYLARRIEALRDEGWTPDQIDALLLRLKREATRVRIAGERPSAGKLAAYVDPITVQTPALDVIDDGIEWALATPDARLAIAMSPQEGKSTRCAVWAPIRALQLDPERRIIVASYAESLASEHARTARNIIENYGSRARDPLTGIPLPDKLGLELADDKSAAGHWTIKGHRGGVFAAGVGGGMTGRPADCITGDTHILTEYGHTTAAAAFDRGDRWIAAYDHGTGTAVWGRVEASRRIDSRPLVTVHTAAGNILACTPDHRVYTGRGYTPAADLRAGDTLVPLHGAGGVPVRRADGQDGAPGSQGDPQGSHDAGVLDRVQRPLSGRGCADSPVRVRGTHPSVAEGDLLRPVFATEAGGPCDHQDLSTMREPVQANDYPDGVLRSAMRERGARGADARARQLALQDRHQLREVVSGDAASNPRPRQAPLRHLRGGPAPDPLHPQGETGGEVRAGDSSRQRGRAGQPARQSDNDVPALPHAAPQVGDDTVARVEHAGREPEPVYDFQVAGFRNFFAGGVLVHNCIIIDDPYKNMEEADSPAYRAKVDEWFKAVVTTRLAPGAPIILIQTRWNEDDLAGSLLAHDRARPEGEREWRFLNIPALAEEGTPDALGREPGTYLQSARGRTPADWERIRRAVGPRVWSALYQGRPTPAGGGLFSRDAFDRYRVEQRPAGTLRIVAVDPADTGKGDEAGVVAGCATGDGTYYWTGDWSGNMTSAEWAWRAVVAALETEAHEVAFEAYSAPTTYQRVIEEAWEDVARISRLIAANGGDQSAAAAALAAGPRPPANALEAVREVAGLRVPASMPFRVTPWKGRGNAEARAAGARQATSTGRLRVAGVLPLLEEQASTWQTGQHCPDRVAAAVIVYERLVSMLGEEAVVAVPRQVAGPSRVGAAMRRSLG